jgi:hypothetical protein
MSTTDLHEIIVTPEAKCMQLMHSERGVSANFSRLGRRREPKLKTPRSVPVGRAESAENYLRQKLNAVKSPDAARALQLMQSDPQLSEISSYVQSPQSTTDFAGLDDTPWTPPDCQIAAGPDHLVVTVNAALAVFDKSGRQILRINLSDLYSPLVHDAIIFNPRVIYDQFRGGWVMVACARSFDEQHSWLLIACSHNEDPSGDWWIWASDARYDGSIRTGHWADGIGLSVDNNSVYLTANMFGGQNNFLYSKLRVIHRMDLQSGGILHGWDFWELRNADGSCAFGVQPAQNLRAAGMQYLLNTTNDGQGLTQWSISYPMRQNPVLTRRFIPAVGFQIAPNAGQPVGDMEIETGDTRLTNVVFRHGLLWAAHTIAANWGEDTSVSAIQWFQINPRAGLIMQQGIYGGPFYHYFCPAVMPDGEGNLLMVFNRTGESEFPSIRITGRLASDEPNTLQASVQLQQSSTSYSGEWSVANGIANLPNDPVVWMIGQYAATEEDWATWIGAATYAVSESEVCYRYLRRTTYA